MTRLDDILRDDKFSQLKLLNSQADLSREVATIESTETPDIVHYLGPNTLLLTTAMVYKNNQKELKDLIVKLNELPSAGLGIKLGRFIDKLDDEVIEEANRLGFPLIQIPADITLGSIFHKLLSHLWDNQNEEFNYSLNIQRKFSNLLVKNTSLGVLIRNLSHTLKKPIALVDPFGNVTHTSGNIQSKYSKSFLRKLVENFAARNKLHESIDIDPQGESTASDIANVYPIKMAGYYPHYLIVFSAQNLKFPLSTMAIEQALMILAFTLYKNLRVAYSLLSGEEEFFKDLIHGASHEKLSEAQLIFKGEKYHFKPSKSYQIILATLSNKEKIFTDASMMEESYILIYNWLKAKLAKDIKGALLFPDRTKGEFIILLQEPTENWIDRLSSYRHILHRTLRVDLHFFVGNHVQSISSIAYSYREALEAVEFGETRNGVEFIRYYHQMDTFDLFQFLPKNQMESFTAHTLKSLAYPVDESTKDLRNTLKTYLDLNCNITDTAQALFIHRNTVKYRIDRCSEILGKDISEPSTSLKLRLCLFYTESH